ncbi:MAG: hypothetical protein JWM72_4281, partial [Actinomycetia bacterium]|nr:hypothetical protein [Actinomycetes bacterium]
MRSDDARLAGTTAPGVGIGPGEPGVQVPVLCGAGNVGGSA